jgi:hypothetical protein
MVCETENPSFLLASCCRVEVVKGLAGLLFPGFLATSSIINSAFSHLNNESFKDDSNYVIC